MMQSIVTFDGGGIASFILPLWTGNPRRLEGGAELPIAGPNMDAPGARCATAFVIWR
jgi:hypothetical protein